MINPDEPGYWISFFRINSEKTSDQHNGFVGDHGDNRRRRAEARLAEGQPAVIESEIEAQPGGYAGALIVMVKVPTKVGRDGFLDDAGAL